MCSIVYVNVARQVGLVKLRQKKAHICEIQVNGGDVAAKVDFARGLFEQKVPVDAVFAKVRHLQDFYSRLLCKCRSSRACCFSK